MGSDLDMSRRNHIRLDDERRQQNVEMTRRFIFTGGYGVASAAVERILKPTSMVPTRVCHLFSP